MFFTNQLDICIDINTSIYIYIYVCVYIYLSTYIYIYTHLQAYVFCLLRAFTSFCFFIFIVSLLIWPTCILFFSSFYFLRLLDLFVHYVLLTKIKQQQKRKEKKKRRI